MKWIILVTYILGNGDVFPTIDGSGEFPLVFDTVNQCQNMINPNDLYDIEILNGKVLATRRHGDGSKEVRLCQMINAEFFR